MIDGDLAVEEPKPGRFRWVYVTTRGAMYIGPRQFGSRAAAIKEGRKWLTEQNQDQWPTEQTSPA